MGPKMPRARPARSLVRHRLQQQRARDEHRQQRQDDSREFAPERRAHRYRSRSIAELRDLAIAVDGNDGVGIDGRAVRHVLAESRLR